MNDFTTLKETLTNIINLAIANPADAVLAFVIIFAEYVLPLLIIVHIIKKRRRRRVQRTANYRNTNYDFANYRANEIKSAFTEDVSDVNNTPATKNGTRDYFREAYLQRGYTNEQIDEIEANAAALYERLHGVKLPTSN